MEVFLQVKVILIDDVYKHGVAGEVVDVTDGYARNYLIPQGLAIKATPGAMKQAEKLRSDAAARRARIRNELQGLAEIIEGTKLYFPVKAGETGKLYGSVTMGDVADALNDKLNIDIDRRRVGEGASLRELGEHTVRVRLGSDLAPPVKVFIHREGEPPESVEAVASSDEEDEETVETEVEEEVTADQPEVVGE